MYTNKQLIGACFRREPIIFNNLEDQFKRTADPIQIEFYDMMDKDDALLCDQEYFRKHHSDNKRDQLFANFYKVEADHNEIILHSFIYGEVHIFRYDAELSYVKDTNKRYFKHQRGGHLSLNFNNTEVTLEAFVFLAKCLFEDVYPLTFKDMIIDVVDGSGSYRTNNKYGRHYNFWLDNVQPTTRDRNLSKGTKQGYIYLPNVQR